MYFAHIYIQTLQHKTYIFSRHWDPNADKTSVILFCSLLDMYKYICFGWHSFENLHVILVSLKKNVRITFMMMVVVVMVIYSVLFIISTG